MLRNTGKLVLSRSIRSNAAKLSPRVGQYLHQPSSLVIHPFLGGRNFSAKPDDKTKPAVAGEEEKKNEEVKKENAVVAGLKSAWKSIREIAANPKQTWQHIKDEAHHYWIGSKLLWSEMKITAQILKRTTHGHELTRRERIQLQRTTKDMLRLVPFAIFVIVPFMELLLPVALKLFPNMLPSTFEDRSKKEESLKKQLEMRLELRQFMKETVYDIAQKKKEVSGEAGSAAVSYLNNSIVFFIQYNDILIV